MEIVINLVVFLLWLAVVRGIYRYLVRNEVLKKHRSYCFCSNSSKCSNLIYAPKTIVVCAAIAAAMLLPLTLIYVAITWRTPLTRTEQREYVRKLEEENCKLRITQEGNVYRKW